MVCWNSLELTIYVTIGIEDNSNVVVCISAVTTLV
jgi:hypothetical protein